MTATATARASEGPSSPKLTKVRERGETMYEVARRALGDSGQWPAVYRLNPTLSRDPKLPIPAGTILRLPAESKVEAEDAPQ
jgi:nucleoid-associated protein YgaU